MLGLSADLASEVSINEPTSFESLGLFVILKSMGLNEFVLSIDGSPET